MGWARQKWAVAVAATVLMAAGCGSDDSSTTSDDDQAAEQTASEELTLDDGWVKAADSGMTAAFGTLRNTSDEDITLVDVSTEAADKGELHVTVDDGSGNAKMQPAEDGFVIPAGGTHELAPGADHLMLMGVNTPLGTGTTASVEVIADDGQEWTFEVPVREFSGAEESYDPNGSSDDAEMSDDMDMESEGEDG